jgi:acyl-CoA thioester hydrolase
LSRNWPDCNSAPVAFPDRITIGIRVAKLGNSSVRYDVGVFREDEAQLSAQGHFIHVYVSRETRRPAAITEEMRRVLQSIQV